MSVHVFVIDLYIYISMRQWTIPQLSEFSCFFSFSNYFDMPAISNKVFSGFLLISSSYV